MLKGFKYELFPTQEQIQSFEQSFGCSRFIYNWGLDLRIKAHTESKKLSSIDLANKLPELKLEFPWLKDVNSQCLQMPLRNLDTAFNNFFKKRAKFPKFKAKHKSRPKFQCPQHVKVDFKEKLISLTKIPDIKFALDREFIGDIKTTTITKTPTNRYFISILVEDGKELPIKPKIDHSQTIGLDLGLRNFTIDSNGNKTENPKFLRKLEKRLKHHQRQFGKKVKGSKNREEQRLKVAKIHEKISNQRKDLIHKTSCKLIAENQTICLEDLAVGNMLKNHCLAKSISDVSWSEFKRQLEYKAEWYGKNIVTIGRFEPSSKLCNCCGFKKTDLTLKDEFWTCSNCNTFHDRDINAAINIKNYGLLSIDKDCKFNKELESKSVIEDAVKLDLMELGTSIKKASQRNLSSKSRPMKRRNSLVCRVVSAAGE